MGIRKEGYKNHVATVAEELMGSEYIDRLASGRLKLDDYGWRRTYSYWVDRYLPLLRTGLDRKHAEGRDEVSFSHNALAAVTPQVDSRIVNAVEGVSWTVADAILNNEPALVVSGVHPVYIRYLFDLSLGVAVEDLRQRQEGASRNYDYGVIQVRAGEYWQARANYYAGLQQSLRETLIAAKSIDELRLSLASL